MLNKASMPSRIGTTEVKLTASLPLCSLMCISPPLPHRLVAARKAVGIFRWITGAFLALLASALLQPALADAQAADPGDEGLRLSGFGTFGLAYIDAPSGWAYRRDLSQPDNRNSLRADVDSRLGLQANYSWGPHVEVVGQLLFAHRAPVAPDTAVIDWAFVALRPTPDLTVRVGRINADIFLLSDHRDVGITYDSARPPVEFYSRLPSSLDGMDIAKVWNLDDVQWRVAAYGGRTRLVTDCIQISDLNPLYGIMASREADGLLVRASAVRVKFANGLTQVQPLVAPLNLLAAGNLGAISAQAAGLAADLNVLGAMNTYGSIGAQYERSSWVFSSEALREWGPHSLAFSAAYASVGRHMGPVTVFGIASGIRYQTGTTVMPEWGAALTPVLGPAGAAEAQYLASQATYGLNSDRAQQHTLSLGLRWDVATRMAVKLQWDHTIIAADGTQLWASAGLQAATANVVSAQVDFTF